MQNIDMKTRVDGFYIVDFRLACCLLDMEETCMSALFPHRNDTIDLAQLNTGQSTWMNLDSSNMFSIFTIRE